MNNTTVNTLFSPILQALWWSVHYVTPLYEYCHGQCITWPHCTCITIISTLLSPIVWLLPRSIHYLAPVYEYYHGQCITWPHCTCITIISTLLSPILWLLPRSIHCLAPLCEYCHGHNTAELHCMGITVVSFHSFAILIQLCWRDWLGICTYCLSLVINYDKNFAHDVSVAWVVHLWPHEPVVTLGVEARLRSWQFLR